MKTFLFHDYETYGLNTKKTRVSQFAAIRTDLDFNIIEEEKFDLLSVPPIDFIPSLEASLVTGLTPHDIIESGKPYLNDHKLFTLIHNIFNENGTCSVGYNSLNFDDEITRNGFYRNLLPIYSREFSNDCSRFDIINIVREFAFLYPKDIKISHDDEGKPIFKLDQLAPLNGFKEDSYHNAFTDVKATIFLAKLIKDKQPHYWDLKINNYKKKDVINYLERNKGEPILYTHATNGGNSSFVEPLAIIQSSYPDSNSYIGIKLSDFDAIKQVLSIPAEEIKKHLYLTNDELSELNMSRLPLVKIIANKLPVLTSYKSLNDLNINSINKPSETIQNNLNFVKDNIDILRKAALKGFMQEDFDNKNQNADLLIYNGFISRQDEALAVKFQKDIQNKNFSSYILYDVFSETKLNILARNIIYRNYSEDIILHKDLSQHYLSFLKVSYNTIKKGYSPLYAYNNEEFDNKNYNNNDKMVEYTLDEIRENISSLIEKNKDDEGKMKIISDFRASLNNLVEIYKHQNGILNSKEIENNKLKQNKPKI